MADKLKAIRYYMPRVERGKMATSMTAAELIAGGLIRLSRFFRFFLF